MSDQKDGAAIKRADAELHREMSRLGRTDLTVWRTFGRKLMDLHAQGELRHGVSSRFLNECPKAATDIRALVNGAFKSKRKFKPGGDKVWRKSDDVRHSIPRHVFKDY
jgi:hypothetical protein